jgi:hypothetical protein
VNPELPHIGSPVTLVVDEARTHAQVTRSDDDHLDLAVDAAPPQVRAGDAVALIEFVDDRGPCRLLGHASMGGEGVVRFAHDGLTQLLLRGDRVRAHVEMPIEVDHGGQTHTRRTRDLRGGGALMPGPFVDPELEEEVPYRLRLPGRPVAIEGMARIARITEAGDIALQFLALSESEQADITLAVFEAQRRR